MPSSLTKASLTNGNSTEFVPTPINQEDVVTATGNF
jgi:hypothetical protein